MKTLLFICFFVGSSLLLAQEDGFRFMPNVGITTPILDNGVGFHVGLNIDRPFSDIFSFEGQVSYAYNQISGSFLSGNQGSTQSINALAGVRLYLAGNSKKTRPYLNVMTGINNHENAIADRSIQRSLNTGFSLGGFVVRKNKVIGLSFDSFDHVALKMGIVF